MPAGPDKEIKLTGPAVAPDAPRGGSRVPVVPGYHLTSYLKTENTYGALVSASPEGAPWLVWLGQRSQVRTPGAMGMDAGGVWWSVLGGAGGVWKWTPMPREGSSSEWMDGVQEFTKTTVLPMVAMVVGTAVGGVGGVIAAALITAATNVARGRRSITEAVVTATKDALPSIAASAAFDETMGAAKAYVKSNALAKMAESAAKYVTSDEVAGARSALVLGTAYVAQVKSLDELKLALPSDSHVVVDAAIAAGASPLDVAAGMGGPDAKVWMDAALSRNAGGPDAPGAGSAGSLLASPVVLGAGATAGLLAFAPALGPLAFIPLGLGLLFGGSSK